MWTNITLVNFGVVPSYERVTKACLSVPVAQELISLMGSVSFSETARSLRLRISGSWYQGSNPRRPYLCQHSMDSPESRCVVAAIDWLWLPSESASILSIHPVTTQGVSLRQTEGGGVCSRVARAISVRFNNLSGHITLWHTFRCEILKTVHWWLPKNTVKPHLL